MTQGYTNEKKENLAFIMSFFVYYNRSCKYRCRSQ